MAERYQASSVPSGIGVHERHLHIATGLRNKSLNAAIETNLGGISLVFPIGSAAGGPTNGAQFGGADFPATAWNPHPPYPMTPTVLLFTLVGDGVTPFVPAALPRTVTIRFRAVGTDQFGNRIEEITPKVSKVVTLTSNFWSVTLSKVFASLDNLYVIHGDGILLGSSASVGWHTVIDPTLSGAASMSISGWSAIMAGIYGAGALFSNYDQAGTHTNWGVATPMQVEPYGPNIPFASPEIMGATATLLREKSGPTVLNTTARLPARGQRTGATTPTTGVAIGRSAAGWIGTPHKFGFFSNDAWVTKIAGIDLGGSSTRAGGLPTTDGQLGEDSIQLTALLRTSMGTRRGSNATSSYPR